MLFHKSIDLNSDEIFVWLVNPHYLDRYQLQSLKSCQDHLQRISLDAKHKNVNSKQPH